MSHLLIVDDDVNTLASLARAFRLAGHEATVCDNAARALELAGSGPSIFWRSRFPPRSCC